ncbi:MAG: S24 family peptidase [Clostridia bacterium]|nr:S24 family peptidase [Clostridia bacterium]
MGYDVPMDVTSNTSEQKIPIYKTSEFSEIPFSSKDIIGYESFDKAFHIENYCALEVTGDSMEPLFSNGDIAILHKQNDYKNGNTCAIWIDHKEISIKKIIQTPSGIDLIAMNPYYPIRHFTKEEMQRIEILGKVIEARKRHIFE